MSGHRIVLHLDRLLAERGVSLVELSRRTGISAVNLSAIKNQHAKAIRFSTLDAICAALDCGVGELIEFRAAAD